MPGNDFLRDEEVYLLGCLRGGPVFRDTLLKTEDDINAMKDLLIDRLVILRKDGKFCLTKEGRRVNNKYG
jgi:hypothetical protein